MKATPETTFLGFDGYKKLLALKDVDVVLIATPACFHPVHLEAAIQAGKNAFMEKPAGVDPPGMRKIIAAGELAQQKGLAIVAGTQRRHQAKYLQNAHALAQGAIGKITGGAGLVVRRRRAGPRARRPARATRSTWSATGTGSA